MATKILVPIPSAANAKKAIPKVAELAKSANAKVTLFHACYSGVGAFAGEGTPDTIRMEEAQEQKFCETYLVQAVKDLKELGVKADWVCKDGLPARQIVGYAQNNGYDLIVMGPLNAEEMI
jgi:nucleotide-binding universal stress UspA family protein